MAFDVRQLFSPQALNMLLQPAMMPQDQSNMLLSREIPPDPTANPVMAVGMPPQQSAPQPMAMPQPQAAPQMAATSPQPQMPQQAPQVASAAPMGLGGFLTPDRKQYLNDLFTGWASGADINKSLAAGATLASANSATRKQTNQTVDWLTKKGLDPEQAKMMASNPTALGDYLKQLYGPKAAGEFHQLDNGDYGVFQNGQFIKQGTAAKPTAQFHQLTPDEIKQRNLDPTKSYQVGADGKVDAIGGGGITINNGDGKLPANFRWVDPNNPNAGVEPIPGGPAEQIASETAGRIGLADNFLKQYDGIKQNVDRGGVTGVWDRAKAGNDDSSEQAQSYRQIQSGVDALTRMLTGAGQNENEARAYASRYLPSYTDDAKSAGAKLDQLKQELESAKAMVLKGRGGSPPVTPASAAIKKFNPETGKIE